MNTRPQYGVFGIIFMKGGATKPPGVGCGKKTLIFQLHFFQTFTPLVYPCRGRPFIYYPTVYLSTLYMW